MERVLDRARKSLKARIDRFGDAIAVDTLAVIDAISDMWRDAGQEAGTALALPKRLLHPFACELLAVGAAAAMAARFVCFEGESYDSPGRAGEMVTELGLRERARELEKEPTDRRRTATRSRLIAFVFELEALHGSLLRMAEDQENVDANANASSYRRAAAAIARVVPNAATLIEIVSWARVLAPFAGA